MRSRHNGSLLCLILSITLMVMVVQGQTFRGRIQGLVTDASQAVIPGATVTLLNIKTAVQTVKVTNDVGLYRFDDIDPGSYTITVELAGFSKHVQENITVQAQSDITVNVALKVGAPTETVTVTESPVAVSFNTTNIALTVDTKLASELPRLDRNPFKLSYLNPAVQDTRRQETNPFLSWSANSVELGGGTDKKNDLQVDGSAIGVGYKASYVPNTDSIQEVNVQQNAVDAEIGHSAGGSVSMTMKAGTNEWHGTAFWVHREPNWNAITDRTTRTTSGQRNNIGGGALGNAIIKNKLFNFFSYELWRMSTPGQVVTTMPSDLERQGDFSQSKNIQGNLKVIYDPYTTTVEGGKVTRQPFAGNKIPSTRFNPITAKVMTALWKPNRNPDNITGANNFSATYSEQWKYYNLSDRVDWFVNEKLRIYGRYSIFKTTSDRVDDLLYPMEYYIPQGSARNAFSYSGDGIYTANPTTVMQFHYTWHKLDDDFSQPAKDLGSGGFSKYWPNSSWYKPFEQNEFATFFPAFFIGSNTQVVGRGGLWYQHPGGWSWNAKLSQQRGAHYLKTGFEMRHSGGISLVNNNKWRFEFPTALTADTYLSPNTQVVGHEFATFLLGALADSSYGQIKPGRAMETNMYAAYIQDDWKVNRRITLNLGLRYELDTPWSDPGNNGSVGMDLTVPNKDIQAAPPTLPAGVLALRTAAPIWNGQWNFVTPDQPGIWKMQKWIFMPRVGMALRINDTTALRVGWARFVAPSEYNFVLGANIYSGLGNMSFLEAPYMGVDALQNALPLNSGIPQQTISDPFPAANPLLLPKGKSFGQYYGLGENNVAWANPEFKRQVNDRVNITFSRQIWNEIVAEVTYFGNFGRDWSVFPRDMNAWDPRIGYNLPSTNKTAMDAQVSNPFYNYLDSTRYPGPRRNQKNIATKELLRPYPQYGGLWMLFQSNQKDRYHALQIKLQRPFKNGYNFLVGYNYRLEKATGYYDELDQYLGKLTWLESGNSMVASPQGSSTLSTQGAASPRHSASIAGSYELPFGRGHAFGSSMPKALDYILGGWQIIGAWYFNSGNILVFGPMVATGDPHLDTPTPAKWFDTSKFSRLPAYTQRTNPRTYSDVTGPIYWEIQASIGKTFQVTERYKIQAKMAAYNLTNRLNRADPNMDVTNSLFGTALRQGNGSQTNVMSGRQLELALKILF
jgi:hypothetical protein